jgi:Zn-dependent protease with chaperone function/uncharacterized RDD family membrane protein YckC
MVNTPEPPELFRGAATLRVPGERRSLVVTFGLLALVIGGAHFLSYFVSTVFSWKEVAVIVVVGMIYVTLGRGRLLGSSIRVHSKQFGHVDEIVAACAHTLKMPVPQVFVRDDPFVPLVAVGIGEPYAIIISAQWVDHITPDELRFLVGRELGHILAGHTRITSLLSTNGRENAIVSIVFGGWLRKIEYTADRLGLLCCRSLDAAISAISVSAFHTVGRKIDLGAFADQQRELEADPSLRMGEWISSTPYATNRIFALRAFARDRAYHEWAERLDRGWLSTPMAAEPLPGTATLGRKAFARPMRRVFAWFIDFALVSALMPDRAIKGFEVVHADKNDPTWFANVADQLNHTAGILNGNLTLMVLLVYCIVLVALAGQTCGMMILDMRVVSAQYGKVGIRGAIGRYLMQGLSYSIIPVGWFRFWGRVQPYEKWSRTRLVEGAQMAAQIERLTAPQLGAAGH